MSIKPTHKISLFVLVFFIVGSIDSLRNMPTAALVGPSLIFFFVVAAITFLLPIALVSAELSSYHPERNGIYQWSKEAFGDKTALLTIWLQWINTTVWFPTILSFITGGIAYLIDPNLAEHTSFIITMILIASWGMTLLSLNNFSVSAKFVTICALFGFILPFCVMFALLIVWLATGHATEIHITLHTMIPNFSSVNNWIALTAIITAFLGMELAAVNIRDINNPQKNYPKGVIVASCIILFTMIVGSLTIASVIPAGKINLISGIFESLKYYLGAFHLTWLTWVISALIVLSSFGETINWIVSPARGLQQAAQDGYLPKILAKNNKHGMPANVLILQAIIVSLVCFAFTLFKHVSDIYWLLTDLSTELYVLMYVLMFLAAISLHYKNKQVIKPFTIPGGDISKWIVCLLGLFSCAVTLCIGFIPPSELDLGSVWHYSLIFASGMIILCLPVFFFMLKTKR